MKSGLITGLQGGFYTVFAEEKSYLCRARGKFRNQKRAPMVGDRVTFTINDDGSGYVQEFSKRKNSFVRPAIANIDQALLVCAAKEPDLQLYLLDKFIALMEHQNVTPLILFTKTDLLNPAEYEELQTVKKMYETIGYEAFLGEEKKIIDEQRLIGLLADKITVLAGQTGVGKSTALNTLSKHTLNLETNAISTALGRGKHTTRQVTLYPLFDGWISDTPGFSSLELDMISIEELTWDFIDFVPYINDCKFRGCLHINEPGCAIKAAVEDGDIFLSRYQSYTQFITEIQEQKVIYKK